MAVIYLRHPNHGAKVAISEMEAENDIQNGWEEFDPNERADEPVDESESAATEPVVAESVASPPAESVNQLQPRRRGRRPREAVE